MLSYAFLLILSENINDIHIEPLELNLGDKKIFESESLSTNGSSLNPRIIMDHVDCCCISTETF